MIGKKTLENKSHNSPYTNATPFYQKENWIFLRGVPLTKLLLGETFQTFILKEQDSGAKVQP